MWVSKSRRLPGGPAPSPKSSEPLAGSEGAATMRRGSALPKPWHGQLLRRVRERPLQIFEHGEMSHIKGCQLESHNVGGRCDEVVAESDAGVAAAISAHHV